MGKWSAPHPRKRVVGCTCQQCGAVFEVPEWKHRQGKGKFCSTPCYRLGSRSADGVEVDGLWFGRTGKNAYYWHKRADKTSISLHRYVWEKHNGPVPQGFVVHHIDHDTSNNELVNLELVVDSDHARYHLERRVASGALDRDAALTKAREAAKAWHRSEEGRRWHREHAERMWRAE